MIPLTDLVKTLSVEELKKTLLNLLTTLGFPVTSWHKGAVYRTLVALFANALQPFVDVQVSIAKSGFLDWAEGDMLVLLADQVYGVTATPASFAVGKVTLNNSAGGSFHWEIGELRVYNPTTKKTYRNVAVVDLAPLETGLEVDIEALEIGTASSSNGGEITALETVAPGVTCTNAVAVVGFDRETEPSIRLRCRLQIAAVSPNGAADAYDYVARTVELNGGVVGVRTNGVFDSDVGDITLYVAGPSGALSGPDVTKIQDAIRKICQPICIDCTVVSATNLVVNVTAVAYVYASQNITSGEGSTILEAHVTNWLSSLNLGGDKVPPDGGKLYVQALSGEVQRPIDTVTATVSLPAANLDVAPNEVVVPGTISITVTVVPG